MNEHAPSSGPPPDRGIVVAGRARLADVDLDYDLAVAAGEHVSVVGPNGAGKSSLLRTIAGHLPLQTGALHIGHQPPRRRGRRVLPLRVVAVRVHLRLDQPVAAGLYMLKVSTEARSVARLIVVR